MFIKLIHNCKYVPKHLYESYKKEYNNFNKLKYIKSISGVHKVVKQCRSDYIHGNKLLGVYIKVNFDILYVNYEDFEVIESIQ